LTEQWYYIFECEPVWQVDSVIALSYPLLQRFIMDSIPFLHAGQVFTIVFEDDLAFAEVRGILDHLLARDAFDAVAQQARTESYWIDLKESSFQVWVSEMDVIVQRQ